MRNFNYSTIGNQKWDSEILGYIAAIYKEAGKQELYLKQRPEELEKLTLSGKTGGVEIYGTTADELPQAVTDPAWKKLGEVESLDGQKFVVFPKSKPVKKYDLLLLWFTTAPPSGPTASLSALAAPPPADRPTYTG